MVAKRLPRRWSANNRVYRVETGVTCANVLRGAGLRQDAREPVCGTDL
jgi:hypothetical protein